MASLRILDLHGLQPYRPILYLQHRLVSARHSGSLKTDIILLLQHEPVFTLGHNGGRENLKVSEEFLRQKGIQVVKTERGGNITYHGPGQITAYPIINLRTVRLRVTDYVSSLEEAMIQTAADYGISAHRNSLNHGVWIGDRKLGSVGIAVRHGITYHGLALNVNLSLEPFSWIIPCGLQGITMTSLKEAGDHDISCKDVKETLAHHLKGALEADPVDTGDKRPRGILNTFCPVQTRL